MKKFACRSVSIIALLAGFAADAWAVNRPFVEGDSIKFVGAELDTLGLEILRWTFKFNVLGKENVSIHIFFPQDSALFIETSPKVEQSHLAQGVWLFRPQTQGEISIIAIGPKEHFEDSKSVYLIKEGSKAAKRDNTTHGPSLKAKPGDKKDEKPHLLSAPRFKRELKTLSWVYTFAIYNKENVTIQMALPDDDDLGITPISSGTLVGQNDGILTITPGKVDSVTIIASGSEHRLKTGAIKYWIKEGDKKVDTVFTIGPELQFNPKFFRPVIGAGIGWLTDDFVDFKVKDDHLLIENDSKNRPIILAGVLVNVKELTRNLKTNSLPGIIKSPLNCLLLPVRTIDDFLFSAEFADGGTKGVDGFAFGICKRISDEFSLVASYSRRKGLELSPGFRQAARSTITEKLKDGSSEDKLKYQRFESYAPGDDKSQKVLDGFPLISATTTNTRVFPGEPIISSYNTSLNIGIVASLNLKGLFSLNK